MGVDLRLLSGALSKDCLAVRELGGMPRLRHPELAIERRMDVATPTPITELVKEEEGVVSAC